MKNKNTLCFITWDKNHFKHSYVNLKHGDIVMVTSYKEYMYLRTCTGPNNDKHHVMIDENVLHKLALCDLST